MLQTIKYLPKPDSLEALFALNNNQGRLYTAFIFGEPASYDDRADEVQQFLSGIEVEQPRLFGIPRGEALVLAGGEQQSAPV